ncbi:hypothetical protein XENOCAPTIV_009626 [Xenoophorus captivus]|uniref:Uncharacterized protein n=1 Tax=Xenoophorus captivus TaxID=1517983 RepID=A0ABV0RCB8_9TELE
MPDQGTSLQTHSQAGGFTQCSNSRRAAAGALRAAVFVKHCVTPAPEQQSGSANPPHPHPLSQTHTELGSIPHSSGLSPHFSSNNFCFLSFPDRFLTVTINLLLFPLSLDPRPLSRISMAMAREGF